MYFLIFGLWLVFNGRITLEIVLLGLLFTAVFALFLAKFLDYRPKDNVRTLRRVVLGVVYVAVLIREIVKSNFVMLNIIFDKDVPVKQTLVTFDVDLKTDFCRMLLANSITLTPGTITVSTEGNRFTVHCLSEEMIEGIESGCFMRLLWKMEAS